MAPAALFASAALVGLALARYSKSFLFSLMVYCFPPIIIVVRDA